MDTHYSKVWSLFFLVTPLPNTIPGTCWSSMQCLLGENSKLFHKQKIRATQSSHLIPTSDLRAILSSNCWDCEDGLRMTSVSCLTHLWSTLGPFSQEKFLLHNPDNSPSQSSANTYPQSRSPHAFQNRNLIEISRPNNSF